MSALPKLKVAADPRYVGGHPYHQSRYIVTEETELEAYENYDTMEPSGKLVRVADKSQSIIAELTDCENQAQLARVMAAAPELLEVVERLFYTINGLSATLAATNRDYACSTLRKETAEAIRLSQIAISKSRGAA